MRHMLLVMICLACIFVGVQGVYSALRKGSLRLSGAAGSRSRLVTRRDNPAQFWFGIFICALIGLFGAAVLALQVLGAIATPRAVAFDATGKAPVQPTPFSEPLRIPS